MSKAQETNLNILLLENHEADAHLVTEYLDLSALTHQLTIVNRLSEGIELLGQYAFDLILVDLSLPDSQGIQTLERLAEHAESKAIIVLTGANDERLSLEALKTGAQDYLVKDTLNGEVLRRSIRYAIERANMLRRAEAHALEIKHSEILLRHIFDANTDAMLILTPQYEIKFLNPAAGELLEASSESLVGEIFPFELQEGKATELEIPSPDGSIRLVELTGVDLIWEGAGALLVILRDVTARRQAQIDLRKEKERLSITLDSITDAVIAVDNEGRIERINQEAARITGVNQDNAIGQALGAILRFQDPKTGKKIKDPSKYLLHKDAADASPELGIPLIQKNGETVLVAADMRCILDNEEDHYGCVVVLRDITHQKIAEDELFKTEKLQSISLLAGGIAHDFNNILTAVLGNISVVRMEMDDSDRHAGKLLAAEKAVLQATSLTQQLLTFSKGGSPTFEATTITQLVEDCAQFILRGSNVSCDIAKTEDIWSVEADKGQIAQVINNLMINADQAMPQGGVISISLANCTMRQDEVSMLKAGKYVSMRISDQGIGITPENLKRIFDPYFTTKEDGNGLGLASSYTIVQRHHGIMTVESEIDVGSTFTIYLPKSTQAASKAPFDEPVEEQVSVKKEIKKGHGRILVMDDMEAMMMVAGEIISMLGYDVEYSTNGKEAIDAYKAAKDGGNPFDAVVFDLTVPGGMGGEEAANILIEYDPDLIAIASSGYSTSNVMSDYKNSAFTAVVPKPYRIKEMSEALHEVLNR
ncbi:MAG: response regulator [Opitutaceae bacterium]